MLPPTDPHSARTPSEAMAAKRPPRRFSPPGLATVAAMAAEPVPIARGTLIGDYRVERRLDEGGMGTVYAAVHPIIDKRVAIKVLHPHVARQEEAVARFIQEARAVNAIGHPGIVDIFGFGRFVDGRHYITMEYLEGQQLLAFLNETGPISPVEMLPVARQLTESLAAAHDKGVVHRDMKPENVFLSVTAGNYKDQAWPPRTKILDFGLAKLIEAEFDDAVPRTRAGVTVGTPYYMSPEQCRGKALDRRADVYSLGVMMYEMITGRVPFYAAESVDVLYMHLTQAPEPPSRHRPVPPEVEELILRCMAKSAADRPASMHELLAELDQLLRALSPDSARDRDPVELQAEASAFFGGVDDGGLAPEVDAAQMINTRPTLPSLPLEVRQAVLMESFARKVDDRRPAGAIDPASNLEEALRAATPGGQAHPSRRVEAQAPDVLVETQPVPALPSMLPSLPDGPAPASSTPGSLTRPSLPTPAALKGSFGQQPGVPAAATAMGPGQETLGQAAPVPSPSPNALLGPARLGPEADGPEHQADPGKEPVTAPTSTYSFGDSRAQVPRGQPTEPVIPLGRELIRGGTPRTRPWLLWAVIGLQSAAILVLLVLLLVRS